MTVPRTPLAIAAVAILVTGGCHARQRMLDGVVRQEAGAPCFSVPPGDIRPSEKLEVALVQVSRITESGAVVSTPWSTPVSMPLAGVTLSPATCIRYAQIKGESPAEPLQADQRYAVFINASIQHQQRHENRRYIAYFCLLPANGGVHQVKWKRSAGRWAWDECDGRGRGRPL